LSPLLLAAILAFGFPGQFAIISLIDINSAAFCHIVFNTTEGTEGRLKLVRGMEIAVACCISASQFSWDGYSSWQRVLRRPWDGGGEDEHSKTSIS